MAATWKGKAVDVFGLAGIPSGFGNAELVGMDVGLGDQWATALLTFPESLPHSAAAVAGDWVRIEIGGETLILGHVISTPSIVDAMTQHVDAVVADLRWRLSTVRVGQSLIGPLSGGGWPDVGAEIHFNPGGFPNRHATLRDQAGGNAYNFQRGSRTFWTLRDALEFVVYWYCAAFTFSAGGLPAAFDDAAMDLNLYLVPGPAAITEICRRAGYVWAPTYSGTATVLTVIGPGGAGSYTINLPVPDQGNNPDRAKNADEWSALSVKTTPTIVDSVDAVEVHGGPTIVETTHTTANVPGGNSLLVVTGRTGDPDHVAEISVDVREYAANFLGSDLVFGSGPKRWLRELVSKIRGDLTTYWPPLDLEVESNLGETVLARDCLWFLASDAEPGTDPTRIVGGFRIDFDQARIYLTERLRKANGKSFSGTKADWLAGQWWFTVATEIEIRRLATMTPSVFHVSAGEPLRVALYRSELRARQWYYSRLPVLSKDSDFIEAATGGVEYYIDPLTDLENLRNRYLAARQWEENTVVVRTLDLPVVDLGVRLLIQPAAVDLIGNEIVVRVTYDVAAGDHTTIVATNNLVRGFMGDI